jgi:hypothetical protein
LNNETGTTPETTPDTNKFYFEMSIKTKGIVSSELTEVVALQEAMHSDFASVYGEGNFTIDILRPVTDEEVTNLEEEAMKAFDDLIADIESDEEPTLN